MAAGMLALGYLLVVGYAVAHWRERTPTTARALCWFALAMTAIVCATVLAASAG